MAYWLYKSEPSTYSISDLKRDKKTNWNNVRNFQARNNLRKAKKGDLAFIYHSGDDKAVVGIAIVLREGYIDPDPEGGDWTQIDIGFKEELKKPVTLAEIKKTDALKDIPLIKQSRLSCMPLDEKHFKAILKLGCSL